MARSCDATGFSRFLDICNQMLAVHKQSSPYSRIEAAARERLQDGKIGVILFAAEPDIPASYFTIEVTQGGLKIVNGGDWNPELVWRVNLAIVNQALDSPQEYIDHPERLKWDWLTDYLGIGRLRLAA